jgi:lipopolysaccharide biosynthesis glycosyltransferase
VLAAVPDLVVPLVSSRFGVAAHAELGLAAEAEYFNAGVLLIDLNRWREERVGKAALRYLRRYRGRVAFLDQEALNAVLVGKWTPLDARWNWNPLFNRLGSRELYYDDFCVLHFSGNLKPWIYRGESEFDRTYYEWVDRTAWRGWRPARSWRSLFVRAYAASRLRKFLYPLEQVHLRLVRRMTRR